MAIITWTEAQFGTHIAATDEEHQTIFNMLNKLHDTVTAGDLPAANALLDKFIPFVAKHFKTEEDLMTAHNYPNFAAHKAAHDKLVETALGLQKQVHEGKAQLSAETTAFVRDWLVNHIPNIDKPYGPYLNDHGVR